MLTHIDDLAFAGVARQAELLRAGELSAPELTARYLERIERLDGDLNAFRVVRAERALEEARLADERLQAGDDAPLLGVPIVVKDNMDVAGELTTHGTGVVAATAAADCEAVRRLRAAGAIVIGKTNLPELALWPQLTESSTWGATRNPWDPARSPGGSSGGSAVAVAAGLAAAALGSDGGGSIRIPAAACGIFGLKPQRGRVPLAPDDDHWLGLTHFGPFARSVEDGALLLDVLAGARGYAAATRAAPAPLRIAVSTKPTMPAKPKAAALEAVASTAALLRSLGHVVSERDPDYGQIQPLFGPRYARGAWLDAQRFGGASDLERRTRGIVRVGARMGRMAAGARAKERARTARINTIFDDHDLLLTPVTAAQPAPVGRFDAAGALRTFLAGADYACYTAVWNVTGQPAASVPAGLDADGMPRAVQLVARPGDEATLLALAAQLEAERPWADVHPPLRTP
ncbi:MAG TPA: amidase [Solirubrobacteraceae bacterium]